MQYTSSIKTRVQLVASFGQPRRKEKAEAVASQIASFAWAVRIGSAVIVALICNFIVNVLATLDSYQFAPAWMNLGIGDAVRFCLAPHAVWREVSTFFAFTPYLLLLSTVGQSVLRGLRLKAYSLLPQVLSVCVLMFLGFAETMNWKGALATTLSLKFELHILAVFAITSLLVQILNERLISRIADSLAK